MSEVFLSTLDYLRLLQRNGFLAIPRSVQKQPIVEEVRVPVYSSLEEIEEAIAACKSCGLHATRTRIVPGEGDPNARVAFVGEAPGQQEDQLGRPFVGEAGALLDRMIVAMRLRREDVFIVNVLKCRPPGNRNPLPEEIAACENFLSQQLRLIRPALIVALGSFAAQWLLKTTQSISRMRGEWGQYEGIPVMPTFHPSYLNRKPAEKHKAWADLQKVMAEYERLVGPLPPKPAE